MLPPVLYGTKLIYPEPGQVKQKGSEKNMEYKTADCMKSRYKCVA